MSMAVVPSWVIVLWRLDSGMDGPRGRVPLEDLRARLSEWSTIEFSLSRDGMAGVWGVCGDIGLPGEQDEGDMDAGATIPGTLVSCRLDELDERCSCIEDVMESPRALFDSFIK